MDIWGWDGMALDYRLAFFLVWNRIGALVCADRIK